MSQQITDFFSSVSPEMAAVSVVVIVAFLAFFWGVIRQLAGMVVLAIGCFVGWIVFTQGQSFYWMQEFSGRYLFGIAVLCGGATFLLLRVLTHWFFSIGGVFSFFSSIFGKSAGKGLIGALISIIPSSFLVLVSASVLRLGGTIDGLDHTANAIFAREGAPSAQQSILRTASRWIDKSRLSELVDRVDPIGIDEVEKLGRILLLTQDARAWSQFSADPAASYLLGHPKVLQLARSAKSRHLLESKNKVAFFQDDELRALASDPEIRTILADVEIDPLLLSALYQQDADGAAHRRAYENPYR